MKSKVLLIGAGGVGTIAAYSLEYGEKAEVTAVVRSDYQKAIERGYCIDSIDYGKVENYRPTNIVQTPNQSIQFGPFDFVVITTKNIPDVSKIEEIISPVVQQKTTIVLIQNGIGIESGIFEHFPGNIVLSGVSMIISTSLNCVIKHEAKDDLAIGYFDNGITDKITQENKARAFIDLYGNRRNHCYYDEDVKFSRWQKLVYNSAFNSVCSLTGIDKKRLVLFGGQDFLITGAMQEIITVAKSDGVELPSDIIGTMLKSGNNVWYKPSMLVDIEKNNYIEVEVIAGNPVSIARKNNVPVPILTVYYELLKVIQMKIKESKGFIEVDESQI